MTNLFTPRVDCALFTAF